MQEIIGLTGPIAAGKNVVGRLLQEKGCAVIDADLLAHQVLEELREQVINKFSETAKEMGILLENSDKTINRKNLGKIVFSSKKKLHELESILYPQITEKVIHFIEENKDKSVVINAAVLYKTPELMEKCTFLLFVDAYPLIRFFRIRARNKLPFFQIFQRFFAQKQLYTQYLKKNVDIYRVRNNRKYVALAQELDKVLSTRN